MDINLSLRMLEEVKVKPAVKTPLWHTPTFLAVGAKRLPDAVSRIHINAAIGKVA